MSFIKTYGRCYLKFPENKYLGYEYVDLGLPSGLKWATMNLGANSITEPGLYFSWGNVEGHKSTNLSTFDDEYDFSTSNMGPYSLTPGSNLSSDIANNDADHDAAFASLGNSWHLPTKDDFKELYDNTDKEWTLIDGINGYKFMKKSDHSIYIFLPASGYGHSTSVDYYNSLGLYWSSSINSSDSGYILGFSNMFIDPLNYNYRYHGLSIRAVFN